MKENSISLISFSVAIPLLAILQTEAETDLGALLSTLISNPTSLAIFLIQLVLGLALGYFSVKVIKYIIALIGIIVIGVVLNIWQLGGIEEFVNRVGLEWSKVYSVIKTILAAFGIMTVLPVTIGFFLGIIIALKK